jgi:hypothetical protein
VASGDLAEEIAKLKAQEGKPIIARGGVSFARSLVAQGLGDQFNRPPRYLQAIRLELRFLRRRAA